jgi:hypothetical protein
VCSEVSTRSTVEDIDVDKTVEVIVVVVDNLEDAEGTTVRKTM